MNNTQIIKSLKVSIQLMTFSDPIKMATAFHQKKIIIKLTSKEITKIH